MSKYVLKTRSTGRHLCIQDNTSRSSESICFRENKLAYNCQAYDRLCELNITRFEYNIYLSEVIPYKKSTINVLVTEYL